MEVETDNEMGHDGCTTLLDDAAKGDWSVVGVAVDGCDSVRIGLCKRGKKMKVASG